MKSTLNSNLTHSTGREYWDGEAGYLRTLVEVGGTRRYGRAGRRASPAPGRRSTGSSASSRRSATPATSSSSGTTSSSAGGEHLSPGRGSAANSAVCYALGITNADAVALGLLFERFLSPALDGPPDIDLDIESGRRDEVIAYVYDRYGGSTPPRWQTSSPTARAPRSATSPGRSATRRGPSTPGRRRSGGRSSRASPTPAPPGARAEADQGGSGVPPEVVRLAAEFEGFPRHLGIHSGGMVICDRPVIAVCPVEWARREGRSVLQWDKEDSAAVGLVKFDLLGLGMLEALHRMVDLVAERHGAEVELATIPQEDAVYDMLARADSIGVFQVESRAQMATLPRLRPASFTTSSSRSRSIRPGPIQGGSVHPYLRRRNGEEEVRYLHPLLQRALEKTLGVPLFQEQLMQIAIDVAGFDAVEADELRQAMSSKRSAARWSGCGGASTGGWPNAGSPARSPTRSTNSSPPSPTSASPSPTRSRSPISSTPRRGSSTTTRRRSSPPS